MALDPSIAAQQQLQAAHERRLIPLSARERRAEAILGGGFALACLLLIIAAPPWSATVQPTVAVSCLIALAVASRVKFSVGPGYTVPSELAFVPLAFATPPALLAPLTAATFAVVHLLDVTRGRLPLSRVALAPANAWFALGPAAVLAAVGAPAAGEVALWVLGAMLAAQVALDFGISALRDALHGDFDLRTLLGDWWLFAVDVALAPAGMLAALAVGERPWAALSLLPLIGVLALFGREREARLRSLAELNAAYRWTALVLGDVVEADDGYTGEHCRDVVDLAVEVGRRLGLPADRMRNLEFGALLHDVGKVTVPKEIINKPGPLDDDEWLIIRRHTIEGQRMLDRVGGFMRDVGVIVRAHHERWDGGGYPDGLAGTAIPLEARIIAACDSWNAMTTDRAYRAALPGAVAARELLEHAGTQFDPDVAAAVLAVVALEISTPSARAVAVMS